MNTATRAHIHAIHETHSISVFLVLTYVSVSSDKCPLMFMGDMHGLHAVCIITVQYSNPSGVSKHSSMQFIESLSENKTRGELFRSSKTTTPSESLLVAVSRPNISPVIKQFLETFSLLSYSAVPHEMSVSLLMTSLSSM